MGNLNGGGAETVEDGSEEAQIVKGLMTEDASPLPDDISRYDVRENEQEVPRTQAGWLKYLPGAGMGVAVCSVCDLPIQGAVYAGKTGGDVHIACVPSISIDNSVHKEVRPRFLDFKEFLPMLFFKILLSNMPLERVAASRSGKCKAREKPATVHPKGIPPCVR